MSSPWPAASARADTLPTRPANDPRNTTAYRKLAAQVVLDEPICWLQLPGCTIRSDTADHVIPWKLAPHLAMVRGNLRGACRHCNSSRQDKTIAELETLRNPPAALEFFR